MYKVWPNGAHLFIYKNAITEDNLYIGLRFVQLKISGVNLKKKEEEEESDIC